ncbi:MAG: chromosomal replication initiator protein DnaA [Chloroflexi bacterium]|nr:chromosomal replication initiator protein DnaA [Chloroflexota bacterium]
MPDRSPQALWETALGQLELQVTRPNFDTWLRGTTGLRIDEGQFVVGVPSDFAVEWLRSRMNVVIGRAVSQLLGDPVSVHFQVLGAPELPVEPSQSVAKTAPSNLRAPDLESHMTFESFTVTAGNRLAYRAACKIAANEATYNPLILYGAPGLGKTHLLHAIGHHAAKAGQRVLALTAEAFVDRYAKAVRTGKPHTFRDPFQRCDLLLLDDLRFLATRSASQEQFFHIFNSLHSSGCLLVLTVDANLDALPGLSERLLSRLRAGLALELSPLSGEDRHTILAAKAAKLAKALPQTIIDVIAKQPYETVRDLEGALNRATAFADLSNSDLSPSATLNALYPISSTSQLDVSPDAIIEMVCRQFNVSLTQITGASRARDITYARHIAMYLLRNHGSRPLVEIGQLLGGRDHSTVLHACRRITKEHKSLPQTRADVELLESKLNDTSVA